MFASCFVKINYRFFSEPYNFSSGISPMNETQYYAGSILFFASTLIIESTAVAILSKNISPKLKITYWNAGLFSGVADTFGRSVGNALYTGFIQARIENFPLINYSVVLIFLLTLIIILIVFLPRLKKHYELKLI